MEEMKENNEINQEAWQVENPWVKFFMDAYKNPSTRKMLSKLAEELGYEIPKPEYENDLEHIKREYDKKLSQLEKEILERRRKEQADYIANLLRNYGLDESHLPAIQQFMIRNGIVNIESAIRYYVNDLVSAQNVMNMPFPKKEQNLIERYKQGGKLALIEDLANLYRGGI